MCIIVAKARFLTNVWNYFFMLTELPGELSGAKVLKNPVLKGIAKVGGKVGLRNSKSEEIVKKWFKIILLIYIPISFMIGILLKLLIKRGTYVVYYRTFIGELIYVPGFTLLLICLIVEEAIYFFRCKKNKNVIKLIIVFMCICIITLKIIPYSETYESYKDLQYVLEGTYCEDVQELKNVYVNIITGKLLTKRLYVETSDFKFQVGSNIVDEENFDSFKAIFNDIKKVKIRYLPNSKILLSIEPVKDEK